MLMLQAGNVTLSIDLDPFSIIPTSVSFRRMTRVRVSKLRLSVFVCAGHTSLKGSRAVIMRIANNLGHDVVG